MLSPSDTILIFVVALLLFGPDHLPKIARQLGDAMRHVQNTTSTFMSEMDRAAATAELKAQPVWDPPQATGLEGEPAEESAATETAGGAEARSIDEAFANELPGTTLHPEDAPELDMPESKTQSKP
jgi:TatA/E family protein of Tat protein translocase